MFVEVKIEEGRVIAKTGRGDVWEFYLNEDNLTMARLVTVWQPTVANGP